MDAELEGIADLPLHEGHVPHWMARYMKRMAKAILAILVDERGPEEVVRRLANPLWFQALNNVIGMDWDSSGATTVTTAMIREALEELRSGVYLLGGKGKAARRVPNELRALSERGLVDERTARSVELASRLSAKVDSALLQDGYELYHHAVVFTESGVWTVVQQGMNPAARMARRYHLTSKPSFSSLEPHEAIVAVRRERVVLDLTSRRSLKARKVMLDLAREDPRKVERALVGIRAALKGVAPLSRWVALGGAEGTVRRASIAYYAPSPSEIRRIGSVLARLNELNPKSFDEMVLTPGVGASTIRALALISDLVYGAPPSTEDPASRYYPFKYAYAVGGKDGIPYPYDRRTAEEVLSILEDAIARAKMGEREKLRAIERLRRVVRV